MVETLKVVLDLNNYAKIVDLMSNTELNELCPIFILCQYTVY